jgi:uncharacterized protein (UPF0218 family)
VSLERKTLNLPEFMRVELKKPLGKLLTGLPDETLNLLRRELKLKKPTYFAVVGDFTSKNILDAGLEPDLVVVDNRVMRAEVPPLDLGERKKITAINQAGTIDASAWSALGEAVILKSRVSVIVEGEEDLLVLPLISLTPIGSLIVYGQPREGMVVVEVTKKINGWVEDFLSRMEES